MTKNILLAITLLAAGCGKKADDKPAPAAKPVDTAKPEPAKPEPAKAEPAKPAPAKTGEPSDADKDLARKAGGPDNLEVAFDKHAVKLVKRLDGDNYVVDLTVDGKVLETIKTGAEKPTADGFHHYEAIATATAQADGVLVVVHTTKVTGKPDDSYDVRLLGKDLAVARSYSFEDVYDPKMDK